MTRGAWFGRDSGRSCRRRLTAGAPPPPALVPAGPWEGDAILGNGHLTAFLAEGPGPAGQGAGALHLYASDFGHDLARAHLAVDTAIPRFVFSVLTNCIRKHRCRDVDVYDRGLTTRVDSFDERTTSERKTQPLVS